jgi:CRISPR-associated protein Cst2
MNIYSLSINGRLTLDLHSLNNEGGEGNQTLTRQVNIVAPDANGQKRVFAVNAISGDMIKHIQAEHLHRICIQKPTELPLCKGCQMFSANRINADRDFIKALGTEKGTAAVMEKLLPYCTMDDLLGILITEGNRSVPRKSVAEYGWIIALPQLSSSDSYFHVKYDASRASTAESGGEGGGNLGQAIFHRPANSGVYAVVANYELWRIGFNDEKHDYSVTDAKDRKERAKALLQSALFSFLQPNGAHRNTQNPHIVDFEGVISYSTAPVPAPTVSALNDAYKTQIRTIAEKLNPIVDNAIQTVSFESLSDFAEKMADLVAGVEPYNIKTPAA